MTVTADDTVLEAILRRDRQVVVAALIVVIAMAWLWILLGGGHRHIGDGHHRRIEP